MAKKPTKAVVQEDDEVQAPAVKAERTGSSTVWVACKLPNGVYIQLQEQMTMNTPVMGGGMKEVKMWARAGEQIRLKGYAVPFGKIPKHTIIGDYGLTEISRSFWDRWIEQNKNLDLVRNGLIYAYGEKASAEDRAAEHAENRCGLEPLNPEKDPRTKETPSPNLTEVTMDSERQKVA